MVQDKIKYQRKPLIHKGKWYSITQDRKQKWQFESCTAHHLKTLESQWFRGFFFTFSWKKRDSPLAVFCGIWGYFRAILGLLVAKVLQIFSPLYPLCHKGLRDFCVYHLLQISQADSFRNASRTFSMVCFSLFHKCVTANVDNLLSEINILPTECYNFATSHSCVQSYHRKSFCPFIFYTQLPV